MAKTTIVQLSDDIDGSEAVETLTFALRGVEYEVDLNAKNIAALEKALDRYVNAGRRKAAGSRNGKAVRGRKPANGSTGGKEDLGALRAWARGNGYEISDRGRIPAEIREAYQAAGH